jgi:hypothetical protein
MNENVHAFFHGRPSDRNGCQRSQKGPSRGLLHRSGHVDSPLCDCGNGASETVRHFLLLCRRYDEQRAHLTRRVGVGGMEVEKLLGYREMVGYTIDYVLETGRFDF